MKYYNFNKSFKINYSEVCTYYSKIIMITIKAK